MPLEWVDAKADILESPRAMELFLDRLGAAFKQALKDRGVEYCAVDGPATYHTGCEFSKVVSLALLNDAGGWKAVVSDGLGIDLGSAQAMPFPSLVTITRSELAQIASQWGDAVAKQSTHACFCNFYIPKAVTKAAKFNDLEIALRVVVAWDVIHSYNICRIDSAFKDLNA